MSLSQLIDVKPENCTLCHRCIAVCPVKFCNDASGDYVKVDPDLCIGCGECLAACEHNARFAIDDFSKFLNGIERGEKIIAVAAPAVASNFPDQYLQLNGWLKSIGVKAIFDVSFGAELTIKSYLEHVTKNKPQCVISQPCPALVTYIQTYKPELIKYLAPADSPMVHTMKMVRAYYKEYSNHKIVIISPCVAKRREFDEVGIGDYNVTIKQLKKYFDENRINLSRFTKVEYDNPPAERAVLFSTPGGLLRTAQREFPEIINITRKIEGPSTIYHYLNNLLNDIDQKKAPVLVDCLNCEKGCNGGTGTSRDKSVDELEYYVEKRNAEVQERYKNKWSKKTSSKKIQKTVDNYWKEGLYGRHYQNLSANSHKIKIPSQQELNKIFHDLNKTKEEDIKNCSACGYNSCEKMATAIFNGLNTIHNCHDYLEKIETQFEENLPLVHRFAEGDLSVRFNDAGVTEASNFFKEFNLSLTSIREMFKKIVELVLITSDLTNRITGESEILASGADEQSSEASQIASAIEEITTTIVKNSQNSNLASKNAHQSVDTANAGGEIVKLTVDGMQGIIQVVYNAASTISQLGNNSQQIGEIVQVIDEIADQTNLLALNAAIEAARAGEQGRGFAVVADEVRKLAERTTKATKEISQMILKIQHDTRDAVQSIQLGSKEAEKGKALAEKSGEALTEIIKMATATVDVANEVAASNEELSASSEQISQNVRLISEVAYTSSKGIKKIADTAEELKVYNDNLERLIGKFVVEEKELIEL